MNNDEIRKLREEYERIKKYQEKLKQCAKRVKELEQMPIIKEYCNLIELLDSSKENKHQVIIQAAQNVNISDYGDIYVCFGMYKEEYFDDMPKVTRVYDIDKASYKCYQSIVCFGGRGIVNVKIDQVDDFENNNIVFFTKKYDDGIEFMRNIQEIYFQEVLENGEEQAREKIKSLINRK